MTSRRTLLRLAAGIPAAAALAACDSVGGSANQGGPADANGAGSDPARGANDLLLVNTSAGLSLLSAADGHPVNRPRAGVVAGDWSATATAEASGADTAVNVWTPNGTLHRAAKVPGQLTPRSVSPGGGFVALVNGRA